MLEAKKRNNLAIALIVIGALSVGAFATTTGGGTGFQDIWNNIVGLMKDQYLGYGIGALLLIKGGRLYLAKDREGAMEHFAGAGAFGSLTAMAEKTAASVMCTVEPFSFNQLLAGLF